MDRLDLETLLSTHSRLLLLEHAEITSERREEVFKSVQELAEVLEQEISISYVPYDTKQHLEPGQLVIGGLGIIQGILDKTQEPEKSHFFINYSQLLRRFDEARNAGNDLLLLSDYDLKDSSSPLRHVLMLLGEQFTGIQDVGSLLDTTIGRYSQDYVSSAQMFASLISGVVHDAGNRKNAEFKEMLVQAYSQGNFQSRLEKPVLLISSRVHASDAESSLKVVSPDGKYDTQECSVVVIDNGYSFRNATDSKLGTGVDVLRQLRSVDKETPVLYETAHDLSRFSAQEIASIESYPSTVLVPKNRSIKICSLEQAQKEQRIHEILKDHDALAQLCVTAKHPRAQPLLTRDGLCVISAKAAPSNIPSDALDAPYLYRMRVLAQFHEVMRAHVLDEVLTNPTISYLRPAQDIKGALEDNFSEYAQAVYDQLYCKHVALITAPTTIAHNDTKWDNWFGGAYLGDFADAVAATEHKDLARALLRLPLTADDIKEAVLLYRSSRDALGSPLEETAQETLQNVAELMILESFRLARFYKGRDEERAQEMIDAAYSFMSGTAQRV